MAGDPSSYVSAPASRIVAVEDLHGDLPQARSALEITGVVSRGRQDLWTGGETVLVPLGDVLDRGEDEIAILSLLQSLDIQARAQGGAVFQDCQYVSDGGHDILFLAIRGYDCVVWSPIYSGDVSDLEDSQIDNIQSVLRKRLESLDAKGMVVGHTPQLSGANCGYNCSVWRIDVGMSS